MPIIRVNTSSNRLKRSAQPGVQASCSADLVRSSVRAALVRKPGQPRLSNEEHKRILEAVQAQDVEGAKGAMHRHLERAMKELG